MRTSSLNRFARLALPILVTACAGTAFAQTVEGSGDNRIMMFDRPPTVDELQNVVSPKGQGTDQPRRTRSIEIVGGMTSGAAQRPRPTTQANYGAPATTQELQQPQPQPAPRKAPQAASRPAPQPASQPTQATSQPAPAAAPDAPQQQAAAPAGEQDAGPGAFGFRVGFAFNSADIPKDSYAYIDAVGGLLAKDPQLALLIEGHTDAVGSAGYNQVLSERRAVSVGEYLVRVHHVDPQRIAVAGKGPSEPVTQDPYDGRNRRVEFKPARLGGTAEAAP